MALIDDIIAYYKLDEASSANADDANGALDLGQVGSPGTTTGKLGAARTFNGSSQYLSGTPIAASTVLTAFTLSCWHYRASSSDTFQWGWLTTSAHTCSVTIWSDGNVYIGVEEGGGNYAPIPFSGTGWHHFVMVFDGTKSTDATRLKLYIDGFPQTWTALFGTAIPTTFTLYDGVFTIARDTVNGRWGTGTADEFGIWDRALSPAEVLLLFNDNSALTYPFTLPDPANDVIAFYDLGSDANDDSGNGENGTNTGVSFNGTHGTFDGADYITLPTGLFSDESLSVSLWMNSPSLTAGYEALFSCIAPGAATSDAMEVMLDGSDYGVGNLFGGAYYDGVFSTTEPLSSGTLHHVVVANNGTSMAIYVDGAFVLSGGSGNFTSAAYGQASCLGARITGAQFYNGTMRCVGLYDRGLTSGEIARLHNYGVPLTWADMDGGGGGGISVGVATETDTAQVITPIKVGPFTIAVGVATETDTANSIGPPTALLEGVVAWWSMDEASGNAVDVHSAGPYPLTQVNDPPGYPVQGKVYGSRFLNPFSSQYFYSTASALRMTGNFSISFWLAPSGSLSGYTQWIIKQYASGSGLGFLLVDYGYAFYFGPTAVTNTGSVFALNQWRHVVAIRNGTTLSVYINGVLDATGTVTIAANATENFHLSDSVAGYRCQATFDEVVLYNRAITEAEVLQHYNNGDGLPYAYAAGGATTLTDDLEYLFVPEVGEPLINRITPAESATLINGATIAALEGGSPLLPAGYTAMLRMDGVDSAAYINGVTFPYRPCTMFCLVRRNNVNIPGSGHKYIVGRSATTLSELVAIIEFTGTNPPIYGDLVQGIGAEAYGDFDWDVSEWHFFAITMDVASSNPQSVRHFSGKYSVANADGQGEHVEGIYTSTIGSAPTRFLFGGNPDASGNTGEFDFAVMGLYSRMMVGSEVEELFEEIKAGLPNLIVSGPIEVVLGIASETDTARPVTVSSPLILNMPMQDFAGSTLVDDLSAYNNNGTLVGAGNTSASSVVGSGGIYLRSLNLDGTDDFISVPGGWNALSSAANGTIQAWVKLDTLDSAASGAGNILFGRASSGGEYCWIQSDGKIEFFAATMAVDTVAAHIAINNWYHIACVKSGTTGLIYVNGVSVSVTGSLDATFAAMTQDLLIGKFGGGSTYNLDGAVTGFKMYSEPRTLEQIQTDYALGVGPFLHMRMQDDLFNTTVEDSSQQNNDGVLPGDYTHDITTAGPGGTLLKALQLGGGAGNWITDVVSVALRDLTIEAWLKRDSIANNDLLNGSDGANWFKFDSATHTIRLTDAGEVSRTQATGVDTTNWHHYAVTRNFLTGALSLKVDGATVGAFSGALSGLFNINSTSDGIFYDGANGYYFNGAVADYRVYPYVLPDAEIAAHYAEGVDIGVSSGNIFRSRIFEGVVR